MALDFSGLLNLGQAQGLQAAQEDFGEAAQGKSTKGMIGGPSRAAQEASQERAKLAQLYKEQQENIRAAEQLRVEIIKGIKAGIDLYILFLKALDCISRMTGDQLYYDMNEAQARATYGALGHSTPIEQEIEGARKRLELLQAARDQEADPRSRDRIEQAIKAHQELIKQLGAHLDQADRQEAGH